MHERIDLTTAATTPFEPAAAHEALKRMIGRWSGPTRTWLDPTAPPDVSTTEASVDAILGGRWLRLAYQGSVLGKPHGGEMLIGFHQDAQVFEVAWVDSFHTGTAIMLSTGATREDGAMAMLGSYGAGEERWGWRTVLRLSEKGELVMEAFNISPDGQEYPAIETRLARR